MASPRDLPTLDLVAVILAAGLTLALLGLISGVIYSASLNPERRVVSENLTQVLTGLSGGVIGILGGLVGYRIGNGRAGPGDGDRPPVVARLDDPPAGMFPTT